MALTTYKTFIQVLITGLLLALIPNCASDAGDDKAATQLGTARLPLQANGSSGALYQLQQAEFRFASPTYLVSVPADPALELLQVDLPVGDYSVELLGGWQMAQLASDGVWTPVDATLISGNPLQAIIADQAVSDLLYTFNVGDDQIPFGFGRARVRIQVNETGSSFSCDIEQYVPDFGCSFADPTACVCTGCEDDGVCDEFDDCYCSDCIGSSACGCLDDGVCSIWGESCSCGDCAAHPYCPSGGGAVCGDGFCDLMAGDTCGCSDCVDDPACGGAYCGDGLCEVATDGCFCVDCGGDPACAGSGYCGDSLCDPTSGETCNCSDCALDPACNGGGDCGDGLCDLATEGCNCGDCVSTPACTGSGYCGDGYCNPAAEPCFCGDCASTPACGGNGSGFACGLVDPQPPTLLCTGDEASCVCVGCVDDGVCGLNDDCIGCADCDPDPFCGTNCNLDGLCDPYLEGCPCADCLVHPSCFF